MGPAASGAGAGADQEGPGRSWGASASGSSPSGLGGFASVWLHGTGRGGPLGPACDSAGVEAGGVAWARWSFLQPALRVRQGLGGSREAWCPHAWPGAWWGPLGSHPDPRNQIGFGPQPERTRCLKAGAAGGPEGRGQPGAQCPMGHQCPCTSRATASCWGQTWSSWKLACDVVLVEPCVVAAGEGGPVCTAAGRELGRPHVGLRHCLQPPGGALQAGP